MIERKPERNHALEYRYENDAAWKRVPNERFEFAGDAICRAGDLTKDATKVYYVRAVRQLPFRVLAVYKSGEKFVGIEQ